MDRLNWLIEILKWLLILFAANQCNFLTFRDFRLPYFMQKYVKNTRKISTQFSNMLFWEIREYHNFIWRDLVRCKIWQNLGFEYSTAARLANRWHQFEPWFAPVLSRTFWKRACRTRGIGVLGLIPIMNKIIE